MTTTIRPTIRLFAYATETEPAPLDISRPEVRSNAIVAPVAVRADTGGQGRSAKLLLRGLDESDRELVSTVLATMRSKCFNDWQIVPEGPAHLALLVAQDAMPFSADDDSIEPLQVLLATHPCAEGQSYLRTPLRYSEFAAALVDVDRWLAILRASSRSADGATMSGGLDDHRSTTA
jgi:hypothetical protein